MLDGWFLTGTKIYYRFDASRPVMQIRTGQPADAVLYVRYPDGSKVVVHSSVIKTTRQHQFLIPLFGRATETPFVELSLPPGHRLHIDGISLVSPR
jgi:hypothetical protein